MNRNLKRESILMLLSALYAVLRKWWHGENLFTDKTTGALSREVMMDILERTVNGRRRGIVSLAFIDLRGLKAYNDTYGHEAGDAYLEAFVVSCMSKLRAGYRMARFGGDEFIILAEVSAENMEMTMKRIQNEVRAPFTYGVSELLESQSAKNWLAVAETQMYSKRGIEVRDRNDPQVFHEVEAFMVQS